MRFLCLTLIALAQICFSQEIESSTPSLKKIDSLKAVLRQAKNSKNDRLAYYLAEDYRFINADSATHYALLAEKWAGKNPKKRSKIYQLLASIKRISADYTSSENYFKRAIQQAKIAKDVPQEIAVLNDYGIMLENRSQYTEALDLYLKALRLSEKQNDLIGAANAQLNIGFVYLSQDEIDEAYNWFKKSLANSIKAKYKKGEAWNYSNIAIVLDRKGQYEESRKYYWKGAAFIDKEKNKREYSRIYFNVANTYKSERRHKEATFYFLKSLELKRLFNDPFDLASTLAKLSVSCRQTGDYTKAVAYAEESLVMARKAESADLEISSLMALSEAYEAVGDYKKALSYEKQVPDLMDDLYNEEKLEKRTEMIEKYESEKKAQENKLLKQKADLATAMLHKKNLTIVTFSLVIALVLVVLLSVYLQSRKKEKLNALLVQQKAEIETKNSLLEEAVFEKNNLMNIVAHDLRAPLDKVKGLSDLLRDADTDPETQKQCLDLITIVTDQGRRLIDDLLCLSKAESTDFVVEKTEVSARPFLENLAKTYQMSAQEKGITLLCEAIETTFYTDTDKLQRILDNLISNALKFSPKEKRVWIRFSERDDAWIFSVRDEGPGISDTDQTKLFRKFQKLTARPTNGEASTGLGLAIVKQLAERLNGSIEVSSTLGEGTTFSLILKK
ncbi:tetratricopeptide repeat-containing sensor histidine kinase [Flavobacterium sp.]|uniref:tetratricopeptide repeat-containing sensor histidine kinase n=1 Tax=Flavobacterium sp. TaxID=239 RepID=UPI0026207A99|nr:tetratricopeptide repeat-containing sensor histidine kinase [Flavobacterium sp.]